MVKFDSICRTCLFEAENMKSIFDTNDCLGDTLQLFEIVMACTSVQVAENDGLPVQICLSCIKHIARSYIFKKLCENSDATLREMLRKSTIADDDVSLIEMKPSSNLCAQEALAYIDTDMFDVKMKFEEGETSIRDPIAGQQYTNCEKDEIKMMNNADDVESQTIQSVNHSDVKADDIEGELMHDEINCESNTLITDKESISPVPDETERPIYRCEECTACFTLENDLKIHIDTHRTHSYLGRPLLCNECGKRFKRAHHLDDHLRTHHASNTFVCKLCDKGYGGASGFNRHMRRAHPNAKKYFCFKCGKGFRRRYGIDGIIPHVKCHMKKCSTCGLKCSDSRQLALHGKKHTNIKRHICNVCDKQFTTAGSLTVHMRIHTGERNHVCSYCGKRFISASALTIHERVHTGERPYICTVCNKGYSNATQLKDHIRMHRNEKLYVCNVCDKRFNTRRNLKIHMWTHRDVQPHQCHLCPKAFTRSATLRDHIKTHTGERNHICEYCKKGFIQAPSLKAHLLRHTGKRFNDG